MKFYCFVCKESYELEDYEKNEDKGVYISKCPYGHKVSRVIGGVKKIPVEEIDKTVCQRCGFKKEECICEEEEDEDFWV